MKASLNECFLLAFLSQMYEVAVSAQNAERVQLESFSGSLGYLHNGLYRDPLLPGIIKWGTFHLYAQSDHTLAWQTV